MKAKAVFLDRDGTLIQERGHISVLGQVKFIKGAYTALRKLQNLGFKLIIVSNQSGVARGILTETEVQKVNRYILSELEKRAIKINRIYYCPHHPEYGNQRYLRNCTCRKPGSGMVKQAQKRLNLSAKNSYVIGDKMTDIELAKNIKGKGILVLTGYGKRELSRLNSRRGRPDFVARNLLQAVKWIASNAK
ncbi:MAG: hypothetical protein A2142_02140 [candidate division Zixibacteria bacterium RBG_16_48_11]|nr:MAG: hypothetical protein A2142_02140 [candidate division Zixibacteria bacterium RBG_16_48_11]